MIGLLVLFPVIKFVLQQVGEFVFGLIGDIIRGLGAVIAMIVLIPITLLYVMMGHWQRASRFGHALFRESVFLGQCLWRGCIHRPLRLFMLDGLLEGLEKRVPKALASPKKNTAKIAREQQFQGYTIVGTLAGGGSGATLYVANPNDKPSWTGHGHDHRVVIKCFTLAEGSGLPQIVRESRALEAARRIGLVIEHQMDQERFYYVMPYHAGEHLGVVIPQLHGQGGTSAGLNQRQLDQVIGYMSDLLGTLNNYHTNGLWHKDVKPENLVVQDGRAHLVDLGLVTPLRSAMTLTTHGTEYFRDPELVRQALRGVKVNDIDGTKFDIYAAGAVLYFSLENTFPAHGGLSRFSKKSPEALKWIVRRAMAEYNQRYDSVAIMREDLIAVLKGNSIWDVRAADLPSMIDNQLIDEHTNESAVLQASAESPSTTHSRASRFINILNWLKGKHKVRDGHQKQGTDYVNSHKRVTRHLRSKMKTVALKTIHQTRHSSHALSGRAKAYASRLRDRNNARKGLVVAGILVIVGAAFVTQQYALETDGGIRKTAIEKMPLPGLDFRPLPEAAYNTAKPLLLINDHPRKGDPEVEHEVFNALNAQKDYRLNLARRNDDAEVALRRSAPSGQLNQYKPTNRVFNELCEEHGLSGVVLVEVDPNDPNRGWHLVVIIPTGASAISGEVSAQMSDPINMPTTDTP